MYYKMIVIVAVGIGTKDDKNYHTKQYLTTTITIPSFYSLTLGHSFDVFLRNALLL
jgi:hypothetical protein